MGYTPRGRKEWDTTEPLHFLFFSSFLCISEVLETSKAASTLDDLSQKSSACTRHES